MNTYAIDTKSSQVPNFIFSGLNLQARRASRAIKQAEKFFPTKQIRARLIINGNAISGTK